jgi:hypothetical protein
MAGQYQVARSGTAPLNRQEGVELVKPLQPEQVVGIVKRRTWSRENCERLRAIGIMLDDEGDKFGIYLIKKADDELTIRQAVHGGHKNIRVRHWNRDKGDWNED